MFSVGPRPTVRRRSGRCGICSCGNPDYCVHYSGRLRYTLSVSGGEENSGQGSGNRLSYCRRGCGGYRTGRRRAQAHPHPRAGRRSRGPRPGLAKPEVSWGSRRPREPAEGGALETRLAEGPRRREARSVGPAPPGGERSRPLWEKPRATGGQAVQDPDCADTASGVCVRGGRSRWNGRAGPVSCIPCIPALRRAAGP
ncbi:hypothetical protein P7K49_019562 [Saguinus oedipus]|uniref:Uncharacterized protein n=1 Tax=Saguinus oedipus TaxID=9490 RepID=A0ABQ9UYS2_SAGOE|nr:hypothetical protein P7K49_019562 [Saguinus oedipus]